MRIYIENSQVVVEFPLTLPRSACRILRADHTHVPRPLDHRVMRGDRIEWMVRNEDLLAILRQFQNIDPIEVQRAVERLRAGTSPAAAPLDIQKRPVIGDWAKAERPGLFVKFLLSPTSKRSIIDQYGKATSSLLGQTIPSKSRLRWFPTLAEMETLLREVIDVTPEHKAKVAKDIFERL